MGAPGFQCGMCEKTFPKKAALLQHMVHHKEMEKIWNCEVCDQTFDDRLSLEQHKIGSGHKPAKTFGCGRCSMQFPTQAALEEHRRFPSTCSDAFRAPQTKKARWKADSAEPPSPFAFAAPAYNYGAPPVRPPSERPPPSVLSYRPPTDLRTQTSMGEILCTICGKTFPNQARYNNHYLACRPQKPPATVHRVEHEEGGAVQPVSSANEHIKAERPSEDPNTSDRPQIALVSIHAHAQGERSAQVSTHPLTKMDGGAQTTETKGKQPIKPSQERVGAKPKGPTKAQAKAAVPAPLPYRCSFAECRKGFRSEAAMKQHQQDSHRLDSVALTNAVREQLKNSGLLRNPVPTADRQIQTSAVPLRPALHAAYPSIGRQQALPPPLQAPPVVTPKQGPAQPVVAGPDDFHQTGKVCEHIVRLVLQEDVLLHHGGMIIYGGLKWKRVPVAKQAALLTMFEEQQLCHLPLFLQSEEYVPTPAVFKDDYDYCYPVADFQPSPDPSPARPGLSIVSLACIKVGLAGGGHGAVKIAAVDFATARILLNHFISIEPGGVQDWKPKLTGLGSAEDIEEIRKDGYKVFKSWEAARSALWKFVDKNTIIVGHNLRADLDALRMIHGRAVDLAILAEKAANGPLSKQQLSLDALSRDLLKMTLPTHEYFGRDALQNAFVVRELALFKLKNDDQWKKWAREKSLDYQRLAQPTK